MQRDKISFKINYFITYNTFVNMNLKGCKNEKLILEETLVNLSATITSEVISSKIKNCKYVISRKMHKRLKYVIRYII